MIILYVNIARYVSIEELHVLSMVSLPLVQHFGLSRYGRVIHLSLPGYKKKSFTQNLFEYLRIKDTKI
ncbi:hypothetical protein [Siminovitchia fortis]|uniref:hypothetical protein n=1 Tax=Siminovitchia fortis TaxID=254758 RepID=UPI001C92FC76|nr:hypothetical protein [Siminovitchia fortis]